MKPVVWGMLSVSNHYKLRVHTNVSKSPLVQLRGIASRSKEKAAEAARELGIAKSYGSYEELLADKEIEAVYIPLPNHLHAEWVKKAADAGKHVLCEKPFAMNAQEAEQAIRHAERKGVLVMEAFMYRFHPQWKRAREIVRAGEIGQVHSVSHDLLLHADRSRRTSGTSWPSGGGGIPDIGCYAVSSARFLLGREPVTRGEPRASRPEAQDRHPDLRHPRLRECPVPSSPSARRPIPGSAWTSLGSGGELSVLIPFNAYPDVPMQVSVTTGVGHPDRSIRLRPTSTWRCSRPSPAPCGKATPVPTPPQDAIDNMKVLDALFRSEKSGGWEKVS